MRPGAPLPEGGDPFAAGSSPGFPTAPPHLIPGVLLLSSGIEAASLLPGSGRSCPPPGYRTPGARHPWAGHRGSAPGKPPELSQQQPGASPVPAQAVLSGPSPALPTAQPSAGQRRTPCPPHPALRTLPKLFTSAWSEAGRKGCSRGGHITSPRHPAPGCVSHAAQPRWPQGVVQWVACGHAERPSAVLAP